MPVLLFRFPLGSDMTSTVPRFLEDFALNDSVESRQNLLKKLVAGSKDAVYYESLVLLQKLDHVLQNKDVDLNKAPIELDEDEKWLFEEAKKKIAECSAKNYHTIEQQLKMRFHLLSYPIDPASTCKFLMQRFGLESNPMSREGELLLKNDSVEKSGRIEDQYPSELDPNHLNDGKLIQLIQNVYLARLSYGSDPFELIAIPFLYQVPIQSDFEDSLIMRYILDHAFNVPIRLSGFVKRLSKVIVACKKQRENDSQLIGRLNLGAMTLDQLSELVEYIPEILDDTNFVVLYLNKLQPPADQFAKAAVDHFVPDDVLHAYLDKALAFLAKVPNGSEQWKRAAMHKKLVLNMYRDHYDADKFLDFLCLPRQQRTNVIFDGKFGYERCISSVDFWLSPQDHNKPFILDLPEISENTLISEYLRVLFIRGTPITTFQGILDYHSFLNPTYAEVMFTAGKMKPHECIDKLGQWKFEFLADQQDFEFTPTSKRSKIWYPEEAIEITLRLKNVKDVSIRVFRINMYSYYRENPKLQSVDPNIDLDGLTPIWESYKTYDQRSSTERFEETFTFSGRNGLASKEFEGRGLWVVDFISGRKNCRALIQKGFVNCIIRPTISGQLATITDENNKRIVSPYAIWAKGKEFQSDPAGNVMIPFSDQQEHNNILVKLQNFAQIVEISNMLEEYKFDASFYVNHENLQKERKATVTIIPFLLINGHRAPITLLQDMKLIILSEDTADISSTYSLADIKFTENQPFKADFRVPSDLAFLRFKLEGKVKRCSGAEKYQSIQAFHVMQLDRKDHDCTNAYVRTNGSGYTLFVTGKNGEPKPKMAVSLELKHKYLSTTIPATLKTNENGEINLGRLANITRIDLPVVSQSIHIKLDEQINSWPTTIFEAQGSVIKLPFHSGEENIIALGKIGVDLTLLEDCTSKISIEDGYLSVNDLLPGKYKLRCVMSKSIMNVVLFITEVVQEVPQEQFWKNLRLGKRWILESPGHSVRKPLTITQVSMGDEAVNVQLNNWSSKTFAIVCGNSTLTHRTPQREFMAGNERRRNLLYPVGHCINNSLFVSGRKLSEEYQYILERARFGKWTSTTLQHPSLLLKRQEHSETTVASKKEHGAVAFDSAPKLNKIANPLYRGERLAAINQHVRFDQIPAYDFLSIQNLETCIIKPNPKGEIRVERSSLGTSNFLCILVVSGEQAVARDIPLFRQLQLPRNDLRHFVRIDPEKAIIRAREVTKLSAPEAPADVYVSQDREVVDSFEKLFSLFKTLKSSEELETFSFLNTWPTLDQYEKLRLYDKHVCHELNFWLMHKDREFFTSVVRVALLSKIQKTFLDLYMLEADVTSFSTDIHKFESLNIFEKVLLAKRMPSIQKIVQALISEYLKTSPPESSVLQMQFDTVLSGTSMSLEKLPDPQAIQPVEPVVNYRASTSLFGSPRTGPSLFPFGGTTNGFFGSSSTAPSQQAQLPSPKAANVLNMSKNVWTADDTLQDEAASFEMEENDSDDEDCELMDWGRKMEEEYNYQYNDRTREYRETNYLLGTADISITGFWLDFLIHKEDDPFLSERFAQASNSFTEQMFALAVMDIPFNNEAQISSQFVAESNQIKVAASTPALVFHRSLKLCEISSDQEILLVVQNIFNASDYGNKQNKRQIVATDKLRNSVEYGMHIVISNMTEESYVIEASYQIPVGSIPTRKSKYLDAVTIRIEPFTTWQEETSFFYFPEDGNYTNVPVSVTVDGELVARSKLTNLIVKQYTEQGVGTDWRTIALHGSNFDVMDYLKTSNLLKTDLSLICQRMDNRTFANDVINVLRERKFYSYDLWIHGIKHNLPLAIRDVMHMQEEELKIVGRHFSSALVDLPNTSANYLKVLDYSPIIKARAHFVGNDTFILNRGFYQQYIRFLEYLSQKTIHDASDLLCLTVYLVYQERLLEARSIHQKLTEMVEKDKYLVNSVQYDYLSAFLNSRVQCELVQSHDQVLESTRDLALKYQKYPVLTWRQRFEDIISIFDDMDGASNIFDNDKQQPTVEQLNVKELNRGPSLDLTVTDQEILVSFANVNTIKVKIYVLNIEMLFSSNPFISKNSSGNYSLVAANYENEFNVEQCTKGSISSNVHSRAASDGFEIVGTSNRDINNIKLEIPVELQNKNILAEVQGSGIIQSNAYFSNALSVRAVESCGLIRVTSNKTGKPNAGAYVKVYARLFTGEVHFWKDGYTAINGVFDYISVTEDNALMGSDASSLKDIMRRVMKLSILVLSADAGGLIKVVEPPK